MTDMFDDDPDEPADVPEIKFALVQQGHGKWMILDTHTDLPAASNGKELVDLDFDDARDIADMLNVEFRANRNPLV